MEYTRELFIELLEKHFGKVLESGGRHHLQNCENKEVAETLDYSERQFGNCLNPSDNTSYKTVINRLLKHDKIKELEKQIEKNRTNRKWYWVAFFLLGLFVALITYWATPTKPTKSVISDVSRQRLFRIIETKNSYQMTIEAILFNDRIKKGKIPPNEIRPELAKLLTRAKDIIMDNRHRLRDMQIYTFNDVNIADVIAQTYSPDEVEDNFKSVIELLSSPNTDISELVEAIEKSAANEHILIEKRVDSLATKIKQK